MSARGNCGECGNDWPDCQCPPVVPTQGGYSVPSQNEGYKEWRRNECADFQPSPRQQIIMDAVRQALSEGLYYTNDVRPRVAQILGVTGDVLSRGALRVEGGDFGMDVYYARQALDAQQRHTAIAKSAAEMRLKVGDVIGATMFNDYKLNHKTEVIEVAAANEYRLKARRGAATVTFTANAHSLRIGIQRAFEKGKRKISYEQFVAERAALHGTPQMGVDADAAGTPINETTVGI